jgi:hypothetical protein
MSAFKAATIGLMFIAAIVIVAVGPNKVLDTFGIANAKGLSVEQRREKARRNQDDWDHFQYDK